MLLRSSRRVGERAIGIDRDSTTIGTGARTAVKVKVSPSPSVNAPPHYRSPCRSRRDRSSVGVNPETRTGHNVLRRDGNRHRGVAGAAVTVVGGHDESVCPGSPPPGAAGQQSACGRTMPSALIVTSHHWWWYPNRYRPGIPVTVGEPTHRTTGDGAVGVGAADSRGEPGNRTGHNVLRGDRDVQDRRAD